MELADYATSDAFDETTRIALELATAMTQTPATVSDACFERARKRFEPAELVELCASIAWENYRARFNRAFALPPDGFAEGAFCVLSAPPAPTEARTRSEPIARNEM